jgi:prepilin-type N-terminal cleavage/methylation domain-containing protein
MAAGKAKSHAQPARLKRGFTLVEIAVVLGIIALVLGALLPLITAQSANARINATKGREDAIRTALITYLGQHGYLPCPADGWAVPGDAGYGHEARTAPAGMPATSPSVGGLPPGTCDQLQATHTPPVFKTYDVSASNPAVASVTVFRGVVPWLDLGLPEDSANDGWNQRITYVVSSLAVVGYSTREAISGMLGGLVICDSLTSGTAVLLTAVYGVGNSPCRSPTSAIPLAFATSAAVALISHGENGYGAFIAPQGATPAGGPVKPYTQAGPGELANIDLGNNVLVQGNYSRSFDDIVLWLTPADLTAPLIRSGALPSTRALLEARFEQARQAVLASLVAGSPAPVITGAGSSAPVYGYEYFLCRVLKDASGQNLFNVQLTAGFGGNVLNAAALPAGIDKDTAGNWFFAYDGASAVNSGASNRVAANGGQVNYDPWGNPLLYTTTLDSGDSASSELFTLLYPPSLGSPPQRPYAYILYSTGPDGVLGDQDDVSSGVSVGALRDSLQRVRTLSTRTAPVAGDTGNSCTAVGSGGTGGGGGGGGTG